MPHTRITFEDRLIALSANARFVLVSLSILLAAQISPWWYASNDSVGYLSIARNLSHMRLANLHSAQLHYPPGYPLLIAPAFLLSTHPFLIISIIHFILAVVTAIGLCVYFRRVAPAASPLLAALVILNVSFCMYYRMVLSETAFLAALVCSVLLLRVITKDLVHRTRPWVILAALVLISFTILIRHIGFLLVPAFALHLIILLLRRRVPIAPALLSLILIAIPAALTLGMLILHERATMPPVRQNWYSHHLANSPYLTQCLEGLRLCIASVGQLLIPGAYKMDSPPHVWLHQDVFIFLIPFLAVCIGYAKLLRRRVDPFILLLPILLVFHVFIWPFDQDTRYLLPVLPIAILCLYSLLHSLHRHRLSILAIFLIMHLGVTIGDFVKQSAHAHRDNALWPQVIEITGHLRTTDLLRAVNPTDPLPFPSPIARLDRAMAPVASIDVEATFTRMIAYQLDIPVLEISDDALTNSVQWLFVASHDIRLPGFQSVASTDDLLLLQRAP